MAPDLDTLARLAEKALPGEAIRSMGYRSVCASSDLHRYGYTVRHWMRLADGTEVLEYLPRLSKLPRLTAACHAEQVAIHRALGLNCVGPREQWYDARGQLELFPWEG